ncbi:MAG: glycosyltransferase family 2 protein [Sulfobacillus sp.]
MVIPLFNHAAYIRECVESVLAQSMEPHEIIIINDGSTDASDDVMRDLCARYERRLTYWAQTNRGAAQSINSGILRATGEVVAILNSDDIFLPTRLEQCAAVLTQEPGVDVVATRIEFIDGAGREVNNVWYTDAIAVGARLGDLALGLSNANFVMTTSNLVVRRSLFEDVGYFAKMRYAHDLEFLLRSLAYNKRLKVLEESLLKYRVHGRNTISEDHSRVRAEWAASLALYLVRAARSQGAEKIHLGRLIDIFEKHGLQKLVLVWIAYLIEECGPYDKIDYEGAVDSVLEEAGA